jgi:hypothetical protein
MLEGKELDKKLGEYGSAFVDINDQLMLEIGVSAKVDILAEAEKLALKSGNSLAVKAVEILNGLLKKDA